MAIRSFQTPAPLTTLASLLLASNPNSALQFAGARGSHILSSFKLDGRILPTARPDGNTPVVARAARTGGIGMRMAGEPENENVWGAADDRSFFDHMRLANSQLELQVQRGPPSKVLDGLSRVWILLLNEADKEGVYTMESIWGGMQHRFLFAFERKDEAERYAGLLQGTDFNLPSLRQCSVGDLVGLCISRSWDVALIRPGALYLPPRDNDYEMKLRAVSARSGYPVAKAPEVTGDLDLLFKEWAATPSTSDVDSQWSESDRERFFEYARTTRAAWRRGKPSEVLAGFPNVWVLLFNPGEDNEGIYTLQQIGGSDSGAFLAFEQLEDAERFAEQLKGTELGGQPTPSSMTPSTLESLCGRTQYDVIVIPDGSFVFPPKENYRFEGGV